MSKYVPSGSTAYEGDEDNIIQALNDNAVITNCAITAQAAPDMTVKSSAGTIRFGNVEVTAAAVNPITVSAADATFDRFDLVHVTSGGAVQILTGTPAPAPVPPALPPSSILLAIITVGHGVTSIVSANINERRIFIGKHSASHAAAGADPLMDSTVPTAVGTAAAGTATVAAHRDHVHPTGAGVPSTQTFGDAAATGAGPAAAMTDHKHGMPANPVSFAAPALTLGTANAAGAASTTIRTDATIAAFDATVPVTQAFGDAAAAGAAAAAARRDHKHGMMAVPAHSSLTGVTADQHHKRTEAKDSSAANPTSVTWTTAFSTTPSVIATSMNTQTSNTCGVNVSARSTTGATIQSIIAVGSTADTAVKCVIAQETT